jgi:nucleotide-binding universal stress UspA family protein
VSSLQRYSHKSVLVALDGSTACEAVLRFLMEIAGPLDMTVMLLHVLEPITPPVADGTVVLFDDIETRRHEAEEYLAPIAAMLRSQGVDTSWALRRGRPADEILAAARESGADLIAMATHGRTGVGRLLFGSVAEAVLRHAPVPVFMIREPDSVAAPAAANRKGAVR